MSSPQESNLVHQGLLYGSTEEFVANAAPLLRGAVERGDPALVVGQPPRLDALRQQLDGHASEIDFHDAREWYRVPAWTLAAYHQYVARRGADRRVWMVGEPVWSDDPADPEGSADRTTEWHRYESIVNVALAGRAASLLCAYDAKTVPAAVLASARQTHPELTAAGGAQRSAEFLTPAEFTGLNRTRPRPAPADATVLAFALPQLAEVRRTASAWATTAGLPDERARELLIAIHEVVSNAVEHGGGHGVAKLWSTPGDVICEVTSPAPMKDPFPGYLPPDARQERGRGLWMARQICSRVDVHSEPEGTRVQLTLARD
jgi:anti-sigma regulatory factor (Ser/Thr protein kinase)